VTWRGTPEELDRVRAAIHLDTAETLAVDIQHLVVEYLACGLLDPSATLTIEARLHAGAVAVKIGGQRTTATGNRMPIEHLYIGPRDAW
jgi:hypothetical protein